MNIELNGAELDALYQLAINGPLDSGDMPSKSGFSSLVGKGLAFRANGPSHLGCVSDDGMRYFKECKWYDGYGYELLNKNK